MRSCGRLPRWNESKERGKASEACSNRSATLNKHVRFSVGISVWRAVVGQLRGEVSVRRLGSARVKRGCFDAKIGAYPCKEGKYQC